MLSQNSFNITINFCQKDGKQMLTGVACKIHKNRWHENSSFLEQHL